MLEIIPFVPEHLDLIIGREPDRSILASLPDAKEVAKGHMQGGPCWTGFWNEKAMACVGIVMLWPGVFEGWAYTSDLVREHPCAFHRAVRKKLEQVTREFKIHRLQLSIPHSHIVSRMWAYRLGFRNEGRMKKFGPDASDYVRYARVT